MPLRQIFKIAVPVVLVALALPSAAFGQASRTWVSGVGDDANPCSRTAPCKTFAGAISKTATKGEINCLDPGGFGGVTINKALTIKCQYTEGGVLVSGTNAIVVNAPATDTVVLRGLDINGLGTGLNGVRIISAKHVAVMDSEIYGFTGGGIDANPTSSLTVYAARNHIHDTNVGIMAAPGNNAIGFVSVVAKSNDIVNNSCGVAAAAFGQANTSTTGAVDCATATNASGISKAALLGLYHNSINFNSIGVLSRGTPAVSEIAYNEIAANTSLALHRLDGGHVKAFTPATNVLSNNAGTDTVDQTAALTKRYAKRRSFRWRASKRANL